MRAQLPGAARFAVQLKAGPALLLDVPFAGWPRIATAHGPERAAFAVHRLAGRAGVAQDWQAYRIPVGSQRRRHSTAETVVHCQNRDRDNYQSCANPCCFLLKARSAKLIIG